VFGSDFGTGELLWSFLWFFLFFIWLWLIITVIADLIRAHDMSGWMKALWVLVIIITPFLGVFLYLIVNGRKMNERAMATAKAIDSAQRDYIRTVAGSGSAADELAKLSALHDAGTLSDDEWAAAKAKLIS
jgi:type VI protein secretion system component VasK